MKPNLRPIKPIKFKICADTDCEQSFTPFSTTDKYCSYECTKKNMKPNKPRKPINKKSSKQKVNDDLYLKLRKIFLKKPENKLCAVCKKTEATEVHHKAGRIGRLLLYVAYWLPVCYDCHTWIHANPKISYKRGFMIKRTSVKI